MIDDGVLALCELSNDIMFEKIPKDKINYYINESLRAGYLVAEQYMGCDIRDMYKESNIKIQFHKVSKGSFGIILRGQMEIGKEDAKVEIYEDSIHTLANKSAMEGIRALSYDEALNLQLSHEYFHFLEYRNKKVVSEQLDPIIIQKVFNIKRTAHINRCSEIAAHAFAKKLQGLEYLPNLYDYSYLIQIKKMTQIQFDKMIQKNSTLYHTNSIV